MTNTINMNDFAVTDEPSTEMPAPQTISIDRAPVESSNLVSVGYDEAHRLLDVEFGNGGVFRYADVPPEVHGELLAADSIGRYFHRLVRGKFKSTKLNP